MIDREKLRALAEACPKGKRAAVWQKYGYGFEDSEPLDTVEVDGHTAIVVAESDSDDSRALAAFTAAVSPEVVIELLGETERMRALLRDCEDFLEAIALSPAPERFKAKLLYDRTQAMDLAGRLSPGWREKLGLPDGPCTLPYEKNYCRCTMVVVPDPDPRPGTPENNRALLNDFPPSPDPAVETPRSRLTRTPRCEKCNSILQNFRHSDGRAGSLICPLCGRLASQGQTDPDPTIEVPREQLGLQPLPKKLGYSVPFIKLTQEEDAQIELEAKVLCDLIERIGEENTLRFQAALDAGQRWYRHVRADRKETIATIIRDDEGNLYGIVVGKETDPIRTEPLSKAEVGRIIDEWPVNECGEKMGIARPIAKNLLEPPPAPKP